MLLINDDVEFEKNFIKSMLDLSKEKNCCVIGPTTDKFGNLTYGGVKYKKNKLSLRHEIKGPDFKEECDTFNANCVLIPYDFFKKTGPIDRHYTHSIGDFDYGLSLKKNGFKLFVNSKFVGVCNRNSKENTWQDCRLNIVERIKKKESPKGLPTKQYFYYCKKNFGIFLALKSVISAYIILLFKK